MAEEKYIEVGGRLHSIATGNVLAGANEILDDAKGKKQSVVNAENDIQLASHESRLNAYTEGKFVTVSNYSALPATGAVDTVYRVSSWDGTANNGQGAVDVTKYSEYAWQNGAYKFLDVKTQIGEVFDISEYNSGAVYTDLANALGNNGINVPSFIRRGGMSVKFKQVITPAKYTVVKTEGVTEQPTGTELQSDPGIINGTYTAGELSVFSTLPATLNSSLTYYLTVTEIVDEQEVTTYTTWVITYAQISDNKYVQYRLMADEWSINTDKWAICSNSIYVDNPEWIYVVADKEHKVLFGTKTDGQFYFGTECPPQIKIYVNKLLTYKVDKENGKSLIDSVVASLLAVKDNPEWKQVITDKNGKIYCGITANDTLKMFAPLDEIHFTKYGLNKLRNDLEQPKHLKTSYFISDWIRGYWENDENPTLIRTYYKLRNYDWLHLPAGTKIEIFFNGYNREACVDVWNEETGEAINIRDWRTSDFSVILSVDSKVLITTTSPDQYVNPSTQVVTAKITTERDTQINNIAKLRIATFNDGDFSGDNITSGSNESRDTFRQLFNEMRVDILATQEDNEYFNSSLQTLPKDEIYGMFRYNDRVGNAPINYHSFCSNYKIDNVRPVTYKLSDSLPPATHVIFQIGELYLNGKCICLCNVHFDWFDIHTRAAQIDKVIEYCSKYEYSIILGDMNPDNREGSDSQHSEWVDNAHKNVYAEDWAKFSQAGYSMVSNGYYGVFDTVMGTKDDDTAGWVPCDNIFVSKNIQITNVNMPIKDWMNDHRPIIADIIIY